jgi:hypothetical protein
LRRSGPAIMLDSHVIHKLLVWSCALWQSIYVCACVCLCVCVCAYTLYNISQVFFFLLASSVVFSLVVLRLKYTSAQACFCRGLELLQESRCSCEPLRRSEWEKDVTHRRRNADRAPRAPRAQSLYHCWHSPPGRRECDSVFLRRSRRKGGVCSTTSGSSLRNRNR